VDAGAAGAPIRAATGLVNRLLAACRHPQRARSTWLPARPTACKAACRRSRRGSSAGRPSSPWRAGCSASHGSSPSQLRAELGIAFGLGPLAFIAAGQGRYERTGWLFGASAPLWERSGRWYTGAPAYEAVHRVARNGRGEDRFWELYAAGAAAPLDYAIERARR
jgi:hypothetical protein